jgi:hypothetical protein
MSWQRLTDPGKARLYYDWAERWTGSQKEIGPEERPLLQQLHKPLHSWVSRGRQQKIGVPQLNEARRDG